MSKFPLCGEESRYRRLRDAVFKFRIEENLHHTVLHSELEHRRMKLIIFDLRRNSEKRLRSRSDRTGKDHARHDVVLVPNRTERQDMRLRGGLKNAQSSSVSIEDDKFMTLP